MWGGDPAGAQPAFAESVTASQRFDDSDLLTMSRLGRGMCLVLRGPDPAGMALLDEIMVGVTSGEVSPMYTGIAYCMMIAGCSDLFDLRRARQWTAALTRWCDSQPDLVPHRRPRRPDRAAEHRGRYEVARCLAGPWGSPSPRTSARSRRVAGHGVDDQCGQPVHRL
jgi:hypothetical protein